MARLRKEGYIRRVTTIADHERHLHTLFEVRGQGSTHIRSVRVDKEGLWTCSCRNSKFRGMCYHVEAVRTNICMRQMLRRLVSFRREPAVVSRAEYDAFFSLERFIAEPIHSAPRYMTISNGVYIDAEPKPDWVYEGLDRLAGTIIEGAWETYGFKKRHFVVFDLLRHTGLDLTTTPLFQRRELLLEVLSKLRIPHVVLGEAGTDFLTKEDLLKKYGKLLLRDGAAPYDSSNYSPRLSVLKGRK